MLIVTSIVLLVNTVFALIVWPPFLRRVSSDERARDAAGRPTRFLIVHRVLIGAALTLAALSGIVGVLGLTAA